MIGKKVFRSCLFLGKIDWIYLYRKCVKLFYLRDISEVISTCSIEKVVNRINRNRRGEGFRSGSRNLVLEEDGRE